MSDVTDFVKLVIFRGAQDRVRWVRALRSTADYYGWTEEFEPWFPKPIREENGYQLMYAPAFIGRGTPHGGKRLRICRSDSRSGHPAGLTNQFTVSNSCRTIDIAELANFSKGDWHWMEDLNGVRLSKEHWLRIYHAGGSRRRAGLVSV